MRIHKILLSVFTVFTCLYLSAQTGKTDTSSTGKLIFKNTDSIKPAAKKPRFDTTFSPKKATIRSAIIPGWGQIYNGQIWKVPLVYGAVGTTAGIFFYNIKYYKDFRNAYIYKTDTDTSNDKLINPRFLALSANSLKQNRDNFRRNVDLSVLAFLIAWGLNVVDATVAAHLKQFDVSDDLSFHVKPTLNIYGQPGFSLVLNFK